MTNKRFFLTFSIFALIYWASSWLGYGWYMEKVHEAGSSQYIFMKLPLIAGALFAFFYFVFQIILLNKRKSKLIPLKILASISIILLVFLAALGISLYRNPPHQEIVKNFLSGSGSYTLMNIIRLIMDSEGLDLLFCFGLGFVSGKFIYSTKTHTLKLFFNAILVWFLIISASELAQFFTPLRHGELLDIACDVTGATLGLILSLPWFWRK